LIEYENIIRKKYEYLRLKFPEDIAHQICKYVTETYTILFYQINKNFTMAAIKEKDSVWRVICKYNNWKFISSC
jgi:hypothetical protein